MAEIPVEDQILCDVCNKQHERYFRDENERASWQTVNANVRSEFVGTTSESGIVCRAGDCEDKWVRDFAQRVATEHCRVRKQTQDTLDERNRIAKASGRGGSRERPDGVAS